MIIPETASTDSRVYDFFIQWHLTERCNLRCSHCYQEKIIKDEMSFPEIKGVVSEVSGMLNAWSDAHGISFSPSFNVTGGEPFLRQDIFKILEEIKNSGFDIYILSNGTLIDERKAEHLSELAINGVQVSIEGPQAVHDRIRGRGSFALAVKGVKNLVKQGIEVTLNATLSNVNYKYLNNLISLALALGVQRLGVSRLVPSGRGKDLLGEMISEVKLKKVYESIMNVKADGLDIVTGDPIASQSKIKSNGDMGSTAYSGCAAGLSGLTFQPDGAINPCRRLSIPIGNLRKDSLREVWSESEVLRRLRDRTQYKGKCGKCSRWALCRGCRAIAYAYSQSRGHNDFLAEDPQCYVEDI